MPPAPSVKDFFEAALASKRARDESTENAAARRRKRAKRSDVPEEPATLATRGERNPSIRQTQFSLEFNNGQKLTEAIMKRLRIEAMNSFVNNQKPVISDEDKPFSPWYHAMKRPYAKFLTKKEKQEHDSTSITTVKMKTIGDDAFYNRSPENRALNEKARRRWGAKPSFFFTHDIPDEHFDIIIDAKTTDAVRAKWKALLRTWTRGDQNYPVTTIRMATQGLAFIYGFDFLTRLATEQLTLLIEAWWDSHPYAHSLAMWATIADCVDFLAIFTDVEGHDQAVREQWRRSLKLRFVNTTLLVWKDMANGDLTTARAFKAEALEEWKSIINTDAEVKESLAGLTVEMVPVQELGGFKSEFELKLTFKKSSTTKEE